PPGSVAQSALTALQAAVVVLVQAMVPRVRQAPSPGTGAASSLAHDLPKFATFSFNRPLQLLSTASQISLVPAQFGLPCPSSAVHTPAGKAQCHEPPVQLSVTAGLLHSALFTPGGTPQIRVL